MDLGIAGKGALVLGSSSGIGSGIARALHAEGARVCLLGRSSERLQAACAEMGTKEYVVADLRKPNEALNSIAEARRLLGSVDILVTNTGGPPKGTFETIADSDWNEQFQNIVLSTMQCARAVLPEMRERRWGRILLITSIAAKEPIAKLTISNVLRAGLLGFANSFSREVAGDGITVNSILPGYTMTDRLKELGRDLDEIASSVPAKRLGTPDELGSLAAFLCSDLAGYITGQAICYDGGASHGI